MIIFLKILTAQQWTPYYLRVDPWNSVGVVTVELVWRLLQISTYSKLRLKNPWRTKFSWNSSYRKLSYVARQIFGIHEELPKDNSSHAGADADVTKSFVQYPKKH